MTKKKMTKKKKKKKKKIGRPEDLNPGLVPLL
jgi:hypothetical protein